MSIYSYIDEKYIRMMSGYLDRFRDVGNGTYNVRCRICGDSAKSEFKARGYFYQTESGNWKYKCHNCAINMSVKNFIKQIIPHLYEEYCFEMFGNKDEIKKTKKVNIEDLKKHSKINYEELSISNKVLSSLIKICDLADNSEGYKYLLERSIPLDRMNQLFYTDNLKDVVKHIPSYDITRVPEIRGIIIPYYKYDNNVAILKCFQIRNIDPSSSMRYLTYDLYNKPLHIYNLENIKKDRPVYVFEGAFDSMFCFNACAASGSSIFQKLAEIKKINNNVIVVFDNDYKINKDIKKLLIEVINHGYSVVLFDENMNGYKDINQYAQAGNKSKKEITEYLQKCTYSNLSATLHLASQTKNRGTIQWAEESQNSIPQRKRQKTNKNSQWAERKNSPFAI